MSQAGLLVPVFPVAIELGLLLPAVELVLDLVVAIEEEEVLLAMGLTGALLIVEFLAATFSGGLGTAFAVVGAFFTRLAAGPFCVINQFKFVGYIWHTKRNTC